MTEEELETIELLGGSRAEIENRRLRDENERLSQACRLAALWLPQVTDNFRLQLDLLPGPMGMTVTEMLDEMARRCREALPPERPPDQV